MNKHKLSDQELWLQVTADSSAAFVILYERYWNRLLQTTNYYLKDMNAAEEIVHDVFVVLWDRRQFLHIANFESYIHITARYHVFKKLKSVKKSPIDYVETLVEHELRAHYVDGTERLIQEDFEIELAAYLQELPPRCQEIFVLSRVKQLSNTEIAEHFGISRFTVENQISIALKCLRAHIKVKS